MANITKRGDTYRIRCSLGYDSQGRQIIRSTTWKPKPGMTERQIEKELNRVAVLFEEKCRRGGGDPHITFEKFAEKWLKEYGGSHLKEKTIHEYRWVARRTYAALGHSQTSTTMNIYAETIRSAEAAAAQVLDDILLHGDSK